MLGEGGGIGRRAPPALQLTRIGPELPDAFRRCLELRVEGHGQGCGVLADGGHGHASVSFASLTSAVIRSTRPRQSSSYRSSRRRATASPWTLVRTTLRRPIRCLLTRPARSSTATCFCTAAKLMG